MLFALDKKELMTLTRSFFQTNHPGQAPELSIDSPIYRSYHVVFPLRFENGPQWVIKIPTDGVRETWGELLSFALALVAKTMLFLRHEKTIPISDVYDFPSTTANPLHFPYIVMSFVNATLLYDLWFRHRRNGTTPEESHSYQVAHSRVSPNP